MVWLMLGPSVAAMATARTNTGKARKMSVTRIISSSTHPPA